MNEIIREICKSMTLWCKKHTKTNKINENCLYTNGNKWCYNIKKGDANMKAINIAQYVIDKCTKENKSISNLQLQKILYYIQGEWLKLNQKVPLFDDDICAWKFGPVVPDIYYTYCGYGGSKITSQYQNANLDKAITSTIDPIIEEKRELFPWDLVDETHHKDGAWDKIFANGLGDHDIIPKALIFEDFLQQK